MRSIESDLSFDLLSRGDTPEMQGLCFSPDGSLLAASCENRVRVWSVASGQCVFEIPMRAHAGQPKMGDRIANETSPLGGGVAFTPAGDLVHAAVLRDGFGMHVRKPSHPDVVQRLAGQPHPVEVIAVSPDGKLAATGDYWRAGHLRVWDLIGQTARDSFEAHPRVIQAIAFATPDIFVSRSFNDVAVWSVERGRRAVLQLEGVGGLAVGAQSIVASHAATIGIYDLDARLLRSFAANHYVWSLALDRDERILAVGRADGQVELRELATGSVLEERTAPSGVSFVAWGCDGTLAADAGGRVRVWAERPLGAAELKASARTDEGDLDARLRRVRDKLTRHGGDDYWSLST